MQKKLIVAISEHLGDSCIQNFHFGRYIVRYMLENLVVRQRASIPQSNYLKYV